MPGVPSRAGTISPQIQGVIQIGTRGILGFAVNGQPKVTYNHWDSYPSGLGLTFLAACRQLAEASPIDLRKRIDTLKMVTEDTPITDDDIEALKPYTDTSVGSTIKNGEIDHSLNWYQLTRGLQGDISKILEVGYLLDAQDFPLDSLFCEWGYVLDLDDKEATLDVYQGFQRRAPTDGLWIGKSIDDDHRNGLDKYYAINRIVSFPLNDLPSDDDFIKIIDTKSGEDE